MDGQCRGHFKTLYSVIDSRRFRLYRGASVTHFRSVCYCHKEEDPSKYKSSHRMKLRMSFINYVIIGCMMIGCGTTKIQGSIKKWRGVR